MPSVKISREFKNSGMSTPSKIRLNTYANASMPSQDPIVISNANGDV